MVPDKRDSAPQLPVLNGAAIVAARGPRNPFNPRRAYHTLVEQELSCDGQLDDVATIFLSNRECPFRCLMCDLWKNTSLESVPPGAIPEQIREAIDSLPPAQHIKLYNSGNFFDSKAIPRKDMPRIADLVSGYRSVVVENHPRLCNDRCVDFQQQCGNQLEVALGLETSHAETLRLLNKQMTTDDFARACDFLHDRDIRTRCFVLVKPPATSEAEGIERAVESVRFAFDQGVSCCAVIPTRGGNGIMEQLQRDGLYSPPTLKSLEVVMNETVGWNRGRVFADLWDIEQFSRCDLCRNARIERLAVMNVTQSIPAPVACSCMELS